MEALNLDRTLEDVESAQSYLCEILSAMGEVVDIEDVVGEFLNPDAPLALTLASGGVPRDFLNIFLEALTEARSRGDARRLTPTHIYRGASRAAWHQKLENLRADVGGDGLESLEHVFTDICNFCLREKRKTVFLLSHGDAAAHPLEHEMVQQLMDWKLVHIVDTDTSAASGRGGRYEAYTLDVSTFMAPRLRNIEIVEFWRTDNQRRPVGLRESPIYELSRATGVVLADVEPEIDAALESLRADLAEPGTE